jgi:hypothetical protein
MDYMQAIGNLKTEIQRADDLSTPLEMFMRDAGNMFVDVMLTNIDENNVNASFAMRQGLNIEPSSDAGGTSVAFTAESEYTEWRNDGVSGTEVQRDTPFSFKSQHPSKAMAQSMSEWLRAKGSPAEDLQATGWAVAYSVLRKGIEGAKFIERAFNDENLNSFENAILTLTEQYTTGKFEKIIPNLK